MFDLKTIQAVNALATPAYPNPTYHGLAQAVKITKQIYRPFLVRDSDPERAFNRRVALYARGAGVSRETARLVIRLHDREFARGDALTAA